MAPIVAPSRANSVPKWDVQVVAAQGNLISPLVEEAFCQSGQRHPAQVPPGWIREAIGSCSLMA